MAEATSGYNRTHLREAIGHFLGYGRGATVGETAWTTPQTNDINSLLKTGENQVFNPPVIEGQPHNWSFMRPFMTVLTVIGTDTVVLPDDFGGFASDLFLDTPGTVRPYSIPVTTPERVEREHSNRPSSTGSPRLAAELQSKGGTLTTGQRSTLYLFPTPDAVYTLKAEYYFYPNTTTDLLPFPAGGALHGELYLASCLAAAELFLDDSRGPRWAHFTERLGAAIHADRKRKGEYLGYNGDNSDSRHGARGHRHGFGDYITLNGVTPD